MILVESRLDHWFSRYQSKLTSLTELRIPFDYVFFPAVHVCPVCGHTLAFCRCKR